MRRKLLIAHLCLTMAIFGIMAFRIYETISTTGPRRGVASLPPLLATDEKCHTLASIFLKGEVYSKIRKNYEITLESETPLIYQHRLFTEFKYRLHDGAIINTKDIELGATLRDDRGRKWEVTTVGKEGKYFELTGNGWIYRGNYLTTGSELSFYSYKIHLKQTNKELSLLIPDLDESYRNKLLVMFKEILEETPAGYFDQSEQIILMGAPSSKGFHISGHFTLMNREIFLYPLTLKSGKKSSSHTLWHEGGHAYLKAIYGQHDLEHRWKDAVYADNDYVTEYAKTDLEEDFAETIAVYIQTNGGLTSIGYRSDFKHRFEILDEIFINNPSLSKRLLLYTRLRSASKGIFVLGTGYGLFYYFEDRP